MTDDEILVVVQAHKEGKQIQVLEIHSGLGWVDCASNNPQWHFGTTNYRVKPEPRKPREWWVYIDDGEIKSCLTREFNEDPSNPIRVREIID